MKFSDNHELIEWNTKWHSLPGGDVFTSSEVHLWVIELDVSPAVMVELQANLSVDERVKSAQFRSDVDRARYAVSHAALRAILSSYVSVPAAELCFQVNASGKPQLVTQGGSDGCLHFNLSHSQALAVVAISEMTEVGVDVEYQRPIPDYQAVVSRYYSAVERETLNNATDPQQTFYRCWTAKEAVVKCVGGGLNMELGDFTVLKDEVRLLDSIVMPIDDWPVLGLHQLDFLPSDYKGALVVRLGTGGALKLVSRVWRGIR